MGIQKKALFITSTYIFIVGVQKDYLILMVLLNV